MKVIDVEANAGAVAVRAAEESREATWERITEEGCPVRSMRGATHLCLGKSPRQKGILWFCCYTICPRIVEDE